MVVVGLTRGAQHSTRIAHKSSMRKLSKKKGRFARSSRPCQGPFFFFPSLAGLSTLALPYVGCPVRARTGHGARRSLLFPTPPPPASRAPSGPPLDPSQKEISQKKKKKKKRRIVSVKFENRHRRPLYVCVPRAKTWLVLGKTVVPE